MLTTLYIPTNPWCGAYNRDLTWSQEDGFNLQQLYSILGCNTVEVVRSPLDVEINGVTYSFSAWADGEARITRRPVNTRATLLLQFGYPIVGPVLVFCEDQHGDQPFTDELFHFIVDDGRFR